MAKWRVGLRLLVWTQLGYLATIVAIVGLVGVARPMVLGWSDDDAVSDRDGATEAVAHGSALVTISGTVVGQQPAILNVKERGGSHAVGFMVGPATVVQRGGGRSALEGLKPGDSVSLVVDGRTGRAERIVAIAGSHGWPVRDWLAVAGPTALVALIIATAILGDRLRTDREVVPGRNRSGGERRSGRLVRQPALMNSPRAS